MSYRLVEITAPKEERDKLCELAERKGVNVERVSDEENGRFTLTVLVSPSAQQDLFDDVQSCMEGQEGEWRMLVLPVQAIIPIPEEEDKKAGEEEVVEESDTATREELYNEISEGAHLDLTRLLLIAISAVVACAGMIAGNVVIIIGAMVIAPLLGPLLAMSLAATLGDASLMLRAVRMSAVGVALAVLVGLLFGLLVPFDPTAKEMLLSTKVGFDNVGLALASGAAAALSVTTGVSGALVGVMVAVALLPPAATLGIMLGTGFLYFASGAGLLLAVNIAAVTLAGQIVFLVQGIHPRTWYEAENAKQSIVISLVFWSALLMVLAGLIWLWRTFSAS